MQGIWVFTGRTDVEAETPILWPPDVRSWFIGRDPDAGKHWGKGEKGTTEDEMAGWHHQLDGHGFGWTQGVGDGQGGPVCCGSWSRKESDTTERLNWTELWIFFAVHGLSLVVVSGGYSPVLLHRLLTEVASPVSEQGSRACRLQELQLAGFSVIGQRL